MERECKQRFMMPDLTKPPPGFTRGSGIDVPSPQYNASHRKVGLARGAVVSLGEARGAAREATGSEGEDQGSLSRNCKKSSE